jgi:hypothetical protein
MAASGEGAVRTWIKAKLTIYMLLNNVGRSPIQMGSAEECALGGTLYMLFVCESCEEEV